MLAALTGVGEHTGYHRWVATSVHVRSRDGAIAIARDGERAQAMDAFNFGKLERRLLVYRRHPDHDMPA